MELGQFKKLLKVMRDNGVTHLKMDAIEVTLDKEALFPKEKQDAVIEDGTDTNNPYKNFPDDILTPDQLAFYSSGGAPEDDPNNEV